MVNADGSGLRRLTQSNSSEGMPTWSPDGRAMAYLSDRGGQWGIYLQRLDDGRVAKLVELDTTYGDWMMERITWGPRR
jgi:TolB protein